MTIKHIPYNPHFYPGGTNSGAGESPVVLIPEGYVLEKVVPITEYEWVLVCFKCEAEMELGVEREIVVRMSPASSREVKVRAKYMGRAKPTV